ncbi:3'-5' exonuclease [Pseudoduganella umbonata]|uniref:DNA 3'-5' helicase n=1 Tax=Pseudoduganella umbonata TaxID=864828 RepID=A0A4P8HWJ7_9BURK|nr:ATP-dependent helicase [Pseudoduganella umbonata]MBB3223793.1 DNA helicase-2/ATP-dependent DNA helicase PcrA [Pseudoduganella umbonata]QCP12785.1 ATP-dependent helicase [Pseudoduganella umbonata]
MAHTPSTEQADILNSRANVVHIDAVAGSGKTTTMAMVARDACARGLAPAAIACLAFSAGARKRFVQKLAEEGAPSGIIVSTVADYALRHLGKLKAVGMLDLPPRITGREMRERIVQAAEQVWERYERAGIATDFDFGIEHSTDRIDHLLQVLRQLKAALKTHQFAEEDFRSVGLHEMSEAHDLPVQLIEICAEYERLREPSPGEFAWQADDDFVPDLVRLLAMYPAALDHLWHAALYLVDEWHDVNAAEFQLITLLKRRGRLVVVGDRDQVIDEARGAELRFSTDTFLAAYPDAVRFPLRRSRRFGPSVSRAVSRLTSRQVESIEGLHTVQHKLRYAPLVAGSCAAAVVAHVKKVHEAEQSVQLSDIAVITRDDDQSIDIENALIDARIPYRCEEVVSYLLRPEILFMRALLHIVSGRYETLEKDAATVQSMVTALAAFVSMPADPQQFENDYMKTSRAPRKTPLEEAIVSVQGAPSALRWFFEGIVTVQRETDSQLTRNWKARFAVCIEELTANSASLPTAASVLQAVQRMVDLPAAVGRAMPRRSEADTAVRSIRSFTQFAEACGTMSIADFLAELHARQRRLSARTDAQRHRAQLVLTTVRAAKGQEWDHVILPYLQRGEFPRTPNLAEEKRFLYVAMTRARASLALAEPDDSHRELWSSLLHGVAARTGGSDSAG